MSRLKTDRFGRLACAVALATALAGCSDLYLDHRDSIALSAGDAIEANKTAQVYDPWPRNSANVNLAANGQRMQSAVERYRTNLTTQPPDPMMLQTSNQTPNTMLTQGAQSGTNATTTTTPAPTASMAVPNQ
jgi:hypothetical protein